MPFIGYAAVLFSSASGKIILATIFICLLIITFLPELLSKQLKEHPPVEISGKVKGD